MRDLFFLSQSVLTCLCNFPTRTIFWKLYVKIVAKNTNWDTFEGNEISEGTSKTSELSARDKAQNETKILVLIKNKKKGCNFFIIQKYDFLLIILFIILAMLNFDR